jgi:aryl-alcohol dehydrogenase-like predicted oxidoreductase
MRYRQFGRLGWQVSEVGYGMWGMGGGWKGSSDDEAIQALHRSVELGCNFFDTAWGYGEGHSEGLLGDLVRAYPDKKLYTASKIPPKNWIWPSQRGSQLADVFPPEHIREYTLKSLENAGLDSLDLMQFHVWEDDWANDESWQRAVSDLKREGLIHGIGVSVNRWEPWNVLNSLRSGHVDAVQVIYNIFDQAPEDELYPLADELNIAIIARVPFDEGTLIGNLTKDTKWEPDDWRSGYFVPENLNSSVDHAEALRPVVPAGMTMAELAMRFILQHPTVSTVIPGMRRLANVEANMATNYEQPLSDELMAELRQHRWDREPTSWSQ